MGKSFTIFISSDNKKGFFREYHISKTQFRYGIGGLVFLGLLFCAFLLDYFSFFSSHLHYQNHQVENKQLKSQLDQMHLKMKRLNFHLHQIEDFSHKIKVMAGLEPFSHSTLAMGPLSHTSFPDLSASLDIRQKVRNSRTLFSLPKTPELINTVPSTSSLDSIVIYIDGLDKKSKLVHQDINLLMEQLYERKDIMSSTPSIIPAKGWISSHFGYRKYPFTGDVSLHEGMDIAASPGTPVYAPANGKIVFAGYKQGYGKVIVIDHGYELSTLYGHLSDIMVSRWQKIDRRQVIGSIGSTGLSSGPHLHYEVRISNVPVDPAKYILNEFF